MTVRMTVEQVNTKKSRAEHVRTAYQIAIFVLKEPCASSVSQESSYPLVGSVLLNVSLMSMQIPKLDFVLIVMMPV